MTKKFSIGMLAVVLAFSATLLGCGNDRRILGSWEGEWDDWAWETTTVTFYGDGRINWNRDIGTFTARNGRLTLTFDGEVEVATYVVSGDTLRIDFDDEDSETFRRRR